LGKEIVHAGMFLRPLKLTCWERVAQLWIPPMNSTKWFYCSSLKKSTHTNKIC